MAKKDSGNGRVVFGGGIGYEAPVPGGKLTGKIKSSGVSADYTSGKNQTSIEVGKDKSVKVKYKRSF